MTGESGTGEQTKPTPSKHSISWKIYGISVGIVASATGINFLHPFLRASNIIMVYLLGATTVALFGKLALYFSIYIKCFGI